MKMSRLNPIMVGVLTSLLPMAILVLVFLYLAGEEVRENREAELRGLAQAVGMAIDHDVMAQIHQLEILATMEGLDHDDLAGFHHHMVAAAKARAGFWLSITLVDPTGQLLLSSLKPIGATLPRTGMPDYVDAVVRTGRPLAYGVLLRGVLTTNSPVILVGVPVIRDGAVKYVLQAAFLPSSLTTILSKPGFPEGWHVTVLDPTMRIVADTKGDEEKIGQAATPSIVANLMNRAGGSFLDASPKGEPTFFSSRQLDQSGWTILLGTPAAEVVDPPWRVRVAGMAALAASILATLEIAWVISRRDRRHRRVETNHLRNVQAARDRAELAEADLLKLNCELEIRVERQTAEIRLAAIVFRHTGEGVMVTDPDAIILSVNAAFSRITGYSAGEAIGQKTSLLRSHHHDDDFYQAMWGCLLRQGRWEGELWNRRKCDDVFVQRMSINAVKNDRDLTTHYVAVFNDITEARSKDNRILHMAYHDALTGLPNRLMLEDRLKQGIPAAHRGGRRLGLLFIDLDRFKIVNDNLGHDIGDLLLREVAKRSTACMRSTDTLARLGGDEFVILMVDVGAPEDCAILGRKIIRTLSEPMTIQEHPIHIGASVGIAVYPDDGADGIELMKCADTAMYAAKDAGRGICRFFQATMSEQASQRMEMETGLRHALANGELSLHYQPKVDARSRETSGYEALLRWESPSLGMVSPVEFIPIAEDSGLIRDIGSWVIDEACRQIAAWRVEGHGLKHVAVNVSARQLPDGVLVGQVAEAIRRHGIPATALEVELTESMVMANPDEAVGIFKALRELGVRVTIDDFGTGYSSLAYLRRLPINVIKVDRSFVMDADTNDEAAGIVRTIVALGKTLGFEVVAEGVETEAQASLLEAAGCDIFQGFLFSRALSAKNGDLLPFLRK